MRIQLYYLPRGWRKAKVWLLLAVGCLLVSSCGEPQDRVERLRQEVTMAVECGDLKNAAAALEEWVSIDPGNLALRVRLGRIYAALGDYGRALSVYQRAHSLDRQNTAVLLEKAKIHMISTDLAAAENALSGVASADRDTGDYLLVYGDLCLLKGDFDGAESCYGQALEDDPANAMARLKFATVLLSKGDRKTSIAMYEHIVIGEEDKPPELLRGMADYWKLADDTAKALSIYRRAIELFPYDIQTKLALVELCQSEDRHGEAIRLLESIQADGGGGIAYQRKFMMAESLLAEGRLKLAEKILAELASLHPDDIGVALLTGKVHLMNREPLFAISRLEAVVDKEPLMPLGHYLLGMSYLAAKHNKLGHQHLMKALELDHDYLEVELALAGYYYKTFDFDLAMAHVSRVEGKMPGNLRPLLHKGNVLLAIGRPKAAHAVFIGAQEIDPGAIAPEYFATRAAERFEPPDTVAARYLRMIQQHPFKYDVLERFVDFGVQQGTQVVEKVEAQLLSLLEKKPQHAPFVNMLLGRVLMSTGSLEQAQIRFKASIAGEVGFPYPYLKLAEILGRKCLLEEKIDVITAAVKRFPDIPQVHLELAATYREWGDVDKAIASLETALVKHSESPEILNNLSVLLLEKGGQLPTAFQLAQRAYELRPSVPYTSDTLGWAYFKKGFFQQACWYITEAIRMDGRLRCSAPAQGLPQGCAGGAGTRGIMKFHLGMVMHSMNNHHRANALLAEALALGLETQQRIEAEKVLSISKLQDS